MASFTQRMLGAAKLDVPTFEEVEADTGATAQALGVVVIVAIASGIGALAVGGIGLLIMTVLISILGWAVWAGLVWLIGTKLLPEAQTSSDWGEIARTTGFAQSPGVLLVLTAIPSLGGLIGLVVSIWMLVAMIVGVRQALDYTQTWRAVVVVLIGFVVNIVLHVLLGLGLAS
ncbi:YIP1 family protein [Algiphilus sp. W345]|uniref:YIP1 family protein n=1 Tax=Banduia mediterranea TaxID=3075609 RepID=A0ABU2WGC6_9GAMM|nr:YIP1 family protein [Algiphilus sp. W345]MDT0496924.1 YIP1 family protein [Algiphilus sp. W345]